MIKNLLKYASVYKQGSVYIIIELGMPEQNSRVGGGNSLQEAYENMDTTPHQCTGPDGGLENALQYAFSQGLLEDPEEDDSLSPIKLIKDPELYQDPDTEELTEDVEDINERLADEIEEKADEASDEWEGWTWTHDPGGLAVNGPGSVDDWDDWEEKRAKKLTPKDLIPYFEYHGVDDPSPADVQETRRSIAAAERQYGKECQGNAAAAAKLAKKAVAQARLGYWDEALDLAEQAASIEKNYGDCPAYRPLVAAIEHAVKIFEE